MRNGERDLTKLEDVTKDLVIKNANNCRLMHV